MRNVYYSYFQIALMKYRSYGFYLFILKGLKIIFINIFWALLSPIAISGHLIGFRRVTVFTDRIGHLAAEFDCFKKMELLGLLPKRRWFFLAPKKRVANCHLLSYWQEHFQIFVNPALCGFLRILSLRYFMVYCIDDFILTNSGAARYYQINSAWGVQKPVLSLRESDRNYLEELLRELGIPEGGWYVCFHNREAGYSPIDEIIHSHRNTAIEDMVPAMQYVIESGGWCVRMGDPSMSQGPAIKGVVDYAHSYLRSPRGDVVLAAGAKYFVGNSSGIWILSSIFGVPCALANMIPVSTLGYSPFDLSIPKLLREISSGNYLKYPYIFSQQMADYRDPIQYEDAGVMPVANTPDEILDLVKEMHERIFDFVESTELEERLKRLYSTLFKKKNYGYGAGGSIGKAFVQKHNHLFL